MRKQRIEERKHKGKYFQQSSFNRKKSLMNTKAALDHHIQAKIL
jgi:hypothetical protein